MSMRQCKRIVSQVNANLPFAPGMLLGNMYLDEGGDNSSKCTNVAADVDGIDDEGTELAGAKLVLDHQAGSKPQHTNDAP